MLEKAFCILSYMDYQRKVIPGFSKYELDTDWNIWGAYNDMTKKVIISKGSEGYLECALLGDDNKRYWKRLHILILETFISPRPPGMVVRHLDDNKFHNCIPQKHCGCNGNLVWGTRKENTADAIRNGKWNPSMPQKFDLKGGEFCYGAKLTNKQVRIIRYAYKYGATQPYLAKIFKVTRSCISGIVYGYNWKNPESQIVF